MIGYKLAKTKDGIYHIIFEDEPKPVLLRLTKDELILLGETLKEYALKFGKDTDPKEILPHHF